MIAVSNTTPLRYLLAIGQAHLFFQLFEKVFVPSAVFEELSAPGAPEIVRHQILSSPAWLEVRTARATDPELLTSRSTGANAKRYCWPKNLDRTFS